MKIFREFIINHLSKPALLNRLQENGVQFNKYANIIFDDPAFTPGESIEKVKLVKVNLTNLGFSKPSIYEDIVSRAEQFGLKLCPLIVAAHLRLEYLDQPAGPYLKIASPKVGNKEDYPRGLYLRNIDNVLWLRGYRASDDWAYSLDMNFVFQS
jgi:hypothetical protein